MFSSVDSPTCCDMVGTGQSRSGLPSPEPSDGLGNEQQPLAGLALCCTSIPAEQRDALYQIAREMGATTTLDLTSAVTHLIVGATDTPKYKYVARERPDVKVLSPSWLQAVRTAWVAGEQVNLQPLENQHRLPTLWNLNVCVTGFNDLEERGNIQAAVGANGATYHGDLTKAVSHLVAASPTGKKYEYAGQWGIKIVTIEWLWQSLQRGMILEETLYSPTIPAELRGRGATKILERQASLGKRKVSDGPSRPAGPEGKRKLRRTLSSKLESQNSGIWEDMGSADINETKPSAEWDEAGAKKDVVNNEGALSEIKSVNHQGQPAAAPIDQHQNSNMESENSGIFQSRVFLIHAFDRRKSLLLQTHLQSNGAIIVDKDRFRSVSAQAEQELFCVVPHDKTYDEIVESLGEQSIIQSEVRLITEMWVEQCLFRKAVVNIDISPLCRPMKQPLSKAFTKLTMTPTSFTDIDLLHLSKAVKLTGAQYNETLTTGTSVLLCGNNAALRPGKLHFALSNAIPAVSVAWLWACLTTGEVQTMDKYMIMGPSQRASSLKSPANMAKHELQHELKDEKQSQEQFNKNVLQQATGDSQHHSSSQPLRELSNSESNSQRRPAVGPILVTENDPFNVRRDKEASPFISHDDEPFTAPGEPEPLSEKAPASESAPVEPSATQRTRQGEREATSDAIAQLRAHIHSTGAGTSQNSPQHRRHRKLGRAPSNPSSIGSHPNSVQPPTIPEVPQYEDDEDYDSRPKKREAFMPSQALMYEHEESKLVREQLLRRTASDGFLEDDGMKRVESIGVVKDAMPVKNDGKGSKRRATAK